MMPTETLQPPDHGESNDVEMSTRGSHEDNVSETVGMIKRSPKVNNSEEFKRRLFLILTIFAIFIATINILQFTLLGIIRDSAWIIALPVIVSTGFVAYISFYCFQYRQYLSEALSGPWPERAARVGVILTVFLNIFFCEFVYFNAVVVKDFKKFVWQTQIDAPTDFSTPSLVLIQNQNVPTKATLDNNATELAQLCANKLIAKPPNQRCFTNWKTYESKAYGKINYVTFSGSAYKNLDMTSDLDIAYLFNYSSRHAPPTLGYAVFDSEILYDFENALDCGIIRWSNFPPFSRNLLTLEQFIIDDKVKAINRAEKCKKFTRYKTYRGIMSQTGVQTPGLDTCDILRLNLYKGPCTGDINLYFSSQLSTSHTSTRGTNWLKFFTEEGAIVGGICFATWFFAIFTQ